MNCNRNCELCQYYKGKREDLECIRVVFVGAKVSVNSKTIYHYGDYSIRIVDYTGDDWHIGRKIMAAKPDVIVDAIDSTDLENSLRLTARLIDMDSKVVMAFTSYDKLLSTDHSLDMESLSGLFGFQSIILGEGNEEDFSKLLGRIVTYYETKEKPHRHVHYGKDVDEAIDIITAEIQKDSCLLDKYHDRYLAVRLLEDPQYILDDILCNIDASSIADIASKEASKLELELGENPCTLVPNARLGFIRGALQETLSHGQDRSDHSTLQRIDSVLTSRIFGFPILFVVLFAVFEATFKFGAYPQEWIENGISALSTWLGSIMTPGWFSNLLIGGIIQGVGAVLAFLPNIIILFFFLSILEDSGYMARAAFLMDKVMHRIGLHGRSFIPMLIGFGCNVPAIMAAKSIDDRRDRTLTMLMVPFMSCSARLPVYLLFVSAFFARQKALVMVGIYVFGIVLSILFAFIMKHTRWFRETNDDYVSELPSFRVPTIRNTGLHIWERVSDYLQKISTVILAASIVIWALEYFPADRTEGGKNKEESCLAMVGKAMEPVMEPLGFDWKMNVCLLTGLPAKEAIVSTMGILYHTDDEESLAEAMRVDGGITPSTALGFMLFVLLYFPCIATIATLRREIGGRWAAFTVVHSLVLAWVVAFICALF